MKERRRRAPRHAAVDNSGLLGPWDLLPWDTDPRFAYAFGLATGMSIVADAGDADWRATVAAVRRHLDQLDARAEWDASARKEAA
jgi:hypothetical protein